MATPSPRAAVTRTSGFSAITYHPPHAHLVDDNGSVRHTFSREAIISTNQSGITTRQPIATSNLVTTQKPGAAIFPNGYISFAEDENGWVVNGKADPLSQPIPFVANRNKRERIRAEIRKLNKEEANVRAEVEAVSERLKQLDLEREINEKSISFPQEERDLKRESIAERLNGLEEDRAKLEKSLAPIIAKRELKLIALSGSANATHNKKFVEPPAAKTTVYPEPLVLDGLTKRDAIKKIPQIKAEIAAIEEEMTSQQSSKTPKRQMVTDEQITFLEGVVTDLEGQMKTVKQYLDDISGTKRKMNGLSASEIRRAEKRFVTGDKSAFFNLPSDEDRVVEQEDQEAQSKFEIMVSHEETVDREEAIEEAIIARDEQPLIDEMRRAVTAEKIEIMRVHGVGLHSQRDKQKTNTTAQEDISPRSNDLTPMRGKMQHGRDRSLTPEG